MESAAVTIFMGVVVLLATGLGSMALFQVSGMQRRQESTERDIVKLTAQLSDFRIHVAEKYTSVDRFNGLEAMILEKLNRIEGKLDQKQDKDHG